MPLTNTSYDVAPGVRTHVNATCVDVAVAVNPVGVLGAAGRGVIVTDFDGDEVPPEFSAHTVTTTAASLLNPVKVALVPDVVAARRPSTYTW
jgi:hypothetical protein